MNEQLLQYIWQFQYFNKAGLCTTDGELLQVLHAGMLNTNQGADFLNAKIKTGTTTWAGSVEVHLKSSDWYKHQHDKDKNYRNVILHVVYEHDEDSTNIPVLELKNRISHILLDKYHSLMTVQAFIPCASMINQVQPIIIDVWKERLIAERLTRKSELILAYQQQNKQHWEESFWWLLAKNFGAKVNGEAFEAIAKSVSINLLAKHKNQLHQLEALLLGQAGLLETGFEDLYPIMLQKEYRFLKTKYNLQPVNIPVHFLRMRPGNFPTVRLAQLAALIHKSSHLFSKITEEPSLALVKELLNVTANDFWHYHYRLNDASVYKPKVLGAAMIENILINTITPSLFAYGLSHQKQAIKEKAVQWLSEIKAEKNHITKGFEALGLINKSATDSQALIELKTNYCNYKKCLHCAIGNALLKRDEVPA